MMVQAGRRNMCRLPIKRVPVGYACYGNLGQRFGFDGTRCVSFQFCSKNGNENNFKTKQLCEKTCIKDARCNLPTPNTGSCSNMGLRQTVSYYDGAKCIRFSYDLGCGSYKPDWNMFHSRWECEDACE